MECVCCVWVVFFFQAEDGIRDRLVTGVQTCALAILDLDVVDLAAWSMVTHLLLNLSETITKG